MRAVNYYIEFKSGKGDTMPITNNQQQERKANFSLNQILYGLLELERHINFQKS